MGRQAFNGPRGQHFFADPNRVSIIGLAGKPGHGPFDTGHKKGEHPLWDERVDLPVDESLAANIRVYGVVEAVKVRKAGKYPEGHPMAGEDIIEVIEGRQRTRSARLASTLAERAGEVPPLLKIEFIKADDEVSVGVMVSANEQRRDDLPSIKARKAARILQLGHAESTVANMFGVDVATIKNWQRFVELDAKVIKAVDTGRISFTAATQLHGLTKEQQQEQLDELIESGAPTVANARRAANGSKPRPRTVNYLPKSKLKKFAGDETWLDGLSDDARALVEVLLGDASAVERVPGLAERLKV